MLYELAQYASEPSEQEQLRKMASSSGEGKVGARGPGPRGPAAARAPAAHPHLPLPQELYLSWVVEARRHILAILQDYPSLRPPIDHLCELLPRLQARYYSIASSSKVGGPGAWLRGGAGAVGSGDCGLPGEPPLPRAGRVKGTLGPGALARSLLPPGAPQLRAHLRRGGGV